MKDLNHWDGVYNINAKPECCWLNFLIKKHAEEVEEDKMRKQEKEEEDDEEEKRKLEQYCDVSSP